MEWIKDPTARFYQRPLYERSEIEGIVADLSPRFHREYLDTQASYPLSDDCLAQMADWISSNYDSSCDLSALGEDVEGATRFAREEAPAIMISAHLWQPQLGPPAATV